MLKDESITDLLRSWREGNVEAGAEVTERLYPELRRLAAHYMRSEPPGHTLQPTALVHELYLKIASAEPIDFENRAHFLAIAATKLRYILVDHARRSKLKQGIELPLSRAQYGSANNEADLLALDEAMERFKSVHSRSCRVVELRFFGGLSDAEIAQVLDVSIPTVRRDFRFARAWLAVHLSSTSPRRPQL